ncbi:MAG: sugar ABC transporter substrate-binding protein [Mesorhizobium sp.]|uniref:ABC transporter substrate-binding protein n=1 Tax=Mesorhizobium sp. TaxID=1871066 RepID=UPI000FE70704|nr:sugar ABC transporter substrate-binding protein [Mesorhizobium sp.]RWO24821.1 MAG: sugar ABC transporter substrate-binding protein [Mesorhizobium sp.]
MALGATAVARATEVTYPSYVWQDPEDSPFYRAFKKGFEEVNPDITIRDIPVPFGAFWDKQFLDLSSGNSADTVTMFDTEVKSYIDNDFLEPLNPYLEKAGISLDDFYPGARAAVKDGKIYGLNLIINPRAMFYNGGVLDKEGLKPPTNLAEFSAAIEKLRHSDKQEFGFATYAKPGAANSLYLEISPIVFGFGGSFFEKGQPTATKPETIEALRFYKKIYDESLIPKGMDIQGYRQLFVQGKVAMYAGGPYMGKLVANASAERGRELGAMPLPFPGKRTFALSVFMGIGKSAKNKDAAAKVLVSMLSRDWQNKLLEIAGQPPGRRDVDFTNYLAANPWFQAFIDAAKDPSTVSFAPDGAEAFAPEVIKIIGNNVESMLFNNVKPEDCCRSNAERTDGCLSQEVAVHTKTASRSATSRRAPLRPATRQIPLRVQVGLAGVRVSSL